MAIEKSIKITDNFDELESAFQDKIKLALELIGQTAEGYAKYDCPVDTGRLRNSITYATNNYKGQGNYTDEKGNSYNDGSAKATPDKYDVYIGSNVEYAPYVEYGDNMDFTTGMAHFLRNSATTHGDEYKKIVETVMKQ